MTFHPFLTDSLYFTDAGLTSRVFVKCRDKDYKVFQQGYRLTVSFVEAEGRKNSLVSFALLLLVGSKETTRSLPSLSVLLFAMHYRHWGGYSPR